MLFRTMVGDDLDRILTCLDEPSVNTTTRERFVDNLRRGSYRPEWTWLALDGDKLAGLAVWWGFAHGDRPHSIDCLYAAPGVAERVPLWAALIAHMPPPFDYHIFTLPGWRADSEITDRIRAAAEAGLGTLVERLRYQWTADDPLPERSSRLTFAAEPDDAAFVDVFARVSVGSLDADTQAGITEFGVTENARRDVAFYRDEMPGPRDAWRLARDANGELVGCALPSANDGGPVVGYLGVVPEHRGHGYARDLLAEITWLLAGDGATVIRADTDTGNRPMAAAFEKAGYHVFAIRLVVS